MTNSDILLVVITLGLLGLLNYAHKISRKTHDIYLHLKGIETKDIVSVSDVPESMSRSDEDEARIEDARKSKKVIIEED